jgi:hypothetical protein
MDRMIEGRTEEETIRLTAEALGVDPVTAAEIIAIERGESDGDVIVVDEAGNPIRPSASPEDPEPAT